MKRKSLSLAVCVVLLLSLLTACNGEPVDNTTTTTADSTVTTTTTAKFSGTKMTFAQGPNNTTVPTSSTTKAKPTKPRVKEVNGIPVPQPAYDEGMCKLAFQDEFDSMATFDFNGQGQPGKNWYIDSDLNKSQPTTKDYSILKERDGAKGVLAIEPKTAKTFDFVTYAKKSDTGYLWTYGYAECRMRFDTEDVPLTESKGGPREGWASFWARDVRDYDRVDWTDMVELDMMEAWPYDERNSKSGICFSGALHHWIHKSASGTGANKDAPIPFALGKRGGKSESYRIDSGWHTYASLWKENYVAWYMDGKFMHAVEFGEGKLPTYYIGDPNKPIESYPNDVNWEGIFTVLNNAKMVITVGGGDKVWPQYVDFVRVWEFS